MHAEYETGTEAGNLKGYKNKWSPLSYDGNNY